MALLENTQLNIKTMVAIVVAVVSIVGPFIWLQASVASLQKAVVSIETKINKIEELQKIDFRVTVLEDENVELFELNDGVQEDLEDIGKFETELKLFMANTNNEFKSIQKSLKY